MSCEKVDVSRFELLMDAGFGAQKAGDILIGHPTIGVGRNVAKDGLGISQEEAEQFNEKIENFKIHKGACR